MTFRALFLAVLVLAFGLGGWWGLKSPRARGVQLSSPESSPLPLAPGGTEHLWEDVKRYGAKGDGKTDDTQAIQKAIDAASARGTKVVMIPPGVYRTSGPGLRITASTVTLMGVGKYISIIRHSGTQPALTVGKGKSPLCKDIKITNLKFKGKGAKGDGILLCDYTVRYSIENVCVRDFKTGTGIRTVNHNHSGHIFGVDVFRNKVGIYIGDQGQYTDITFSKICANKKYGVELMDNNVINIISTQLEKNGKGGGASVIARGVAALNLIGCYNEQNHIYNGPFLILTRGVTRGPCRAVNLIGCRSIGNNKAPHAIVLESAHNVNFTGNAIGSFPGGIFVFRPLGPNQVKMISGQNNVLRGPIGSDIFAIK